MLKALFVEFVVLLSEFHIGFSSWTHLCFICLGLLVAPRFDGFGPHILLTS